MKSLPVPCTRALVCAALFTVACAASATHSEGESIPEGQTFHQPDSNAGAPSASPAPSASTALEALRELTQGIAGSDEPPEFLSPDEAFVVSAYAEDGDTVDGAESGHGADQQTDDTPDDDHGQIERLHSLR